MNIRGISNTPFKGAYIVSGRGGDVKEVENNIFSKMGDKSRFTVLGGDYSTNDLPANLLVATEGDIKDFSTFAINQQQYKSEILKKMPVKYTEKDFDTKRDYILYRINHANIIGLKALMENCPFTREPDILDAEAVLGAIETDCFDCRSGKFILPETVDIIEE